MVEVAVVFLDVGQGDCTLAVDSDNGQAILVDCPAGRSSDAVAGLRRAGASRVSIAFATHSDLDHLGGIYEVIAAVGGDEVRINLDSIVAAGDVAGRTKLRAAQRAFAGLADRGVVVAPCYSGDTGRRGDLVWRALSPTHQLLLMAQGTGDRNVGSLILRLEVQDVRVLVAGDAPAGAFQRAADRGEDLEADIFRLSHHGGRIDQLGGPAIGQLLDLINARHHVVSVGSDNSYGHPSVETLIELGRRSGRARVTCTEVNATCAGAAALPLHQAKMLPGKSQVGAGDRAGACRCAGTVWIQIADGAWRVEPAVENHGLVIDMLDNPMCRVATVGGGDNDETPSPLTPAVPDHTATERTGSPAMPTPFSTDEEGVNEAMSG